MLRQYNVQAETTLGMGLEGQPCSLRGLADHFGKLGGRWRCQIEPPLTFGKREQFGNICRAMPEIGAQRDDHPHRTRLRQPGEELNECTPILGCDARNRE
jgi:hypothetical protein